MIIKNFVALFSVAFLLMSAGLTEYLFVSFLGSLFQKAMPKNLKNLLKSTESRLATIVLGNPTAFVYEIIYL